MSSQISKHIHIDQAIEDHALVTLVDETGTLFVIETGYTFASMAAGGDFEWRLVSDFETVIDRGNRAFAHVMTAQCPRELRPAALLSLHGRHHVAADKGEGVSCFAR